MIRALSFHMHKYYNASTKSKITKEAELLTPIRFIHIFIFHTNYSTLLATSQENLFESLQKEL